MTATERVQAALDAKGGVEWLWDEIAALRDIPDIAKALGVTVRALYRWRDSDEDRQIEWAAALKVSGDMAAAEGKKILDDLERERNQLGARRLESSHVALATERARSRMKIAAARHAEAWGERPQVQVNQSFNFGSAHLEALKQFGSMAKAHEIVAPEPVKALPAPQTFHMEQPVEAPSYPSVEPPTRPNIPQQPPIDPAKPWSRVKDPDTSEIGARWGLKRRLPPDGPDPDDVPIDGEWED